MTEISGFYAVLDRESPELAKSLISSAAGGARVLQLRIKPDRPVSARDLLRAARMARQLCHEHGALFVVNDRVDIALAAEADGVHLGQTDLAIGDARQIAPGLLIGVSTHNAEQVRAAVAAGADYLGYGPVFPTATKNDPDPVQGLEALAEAVTIAGDVPIVAIGGITAENAPAVAATGAAAACAISAVNDAADPAAAARAINAAFA